MAEIRRLICTTLGHVDHGKSSILDKIRGSAIVKGEAGAITQAIGASIIPLEVIRKICGDLLKSLKTKFTIPGFLFIDTPGHAAFTNLRKRGGNLADIALHNASASSYLFAIITPLSCFPYSYYQS